MTRIDWPQRMLKLRSSHGGRGAAKVWRRAILACLVASVGFSLLPQPRAQEPQPTVLPATIEPIYSKDPNDAWNRIFYYLFSRRFKARLSGEFPEGKPFEEFESESKMLVSSRLVERTETGDRSIDPLYYPYPGTAEGRRQLLTEPMYSGIVAALQEALSDTAQRPAIARAMMQSDLWAAYEILLEPLFPEDRSAELDHRHQAVLDLLGKMVAKLALTRVEIQSLPDSYDAARAKYSLPDLFSKNSAWIEIEWFPDRTHDAVSNYRRFTRVFLMPAHPPQDKQKFLDSLRNPEQDMSAKLDGVALVMQSILVDAQGNLAPTRLTTDVQLRLFKKSDQGVFQGPEIRVYELSRKLMLAAPETGGLASEDENSQSYRGGYGFAPPNYRNGPSDQPAPPIVVKLKTRCQHCHGEDATSLMTFMIALPPHSKPPKVRELDPAASEAAETSLSRKNASYDFKLLRAYF
jgi:hypothetical protein